MNVDHFLKSIAQSIHWVPRGRSGGYSFEVFPDLDVDKTRMSKSKYRKRKHRNKIAKLSRKKNR